MSASANPLEPICLDYHSCDSDINPPCAASLRSVYRPWSLNIQRHINVRVHLHIRQQFTVDVAMDTMKCLAPVRGTPRNSQERGLFFPQTLPGASPVPLKDTRWRSEPPVGSSAHCCVVLHMDIWLLHLFPREEVLQLMRSQKAALWQPPLILVSDSRW